MNWDEVKVDWERFSGKAKEKWDQLTDEDLAAGDREQVVSRLQERYGWSREQAERELEELTRGW